MATLNREVEEGEQNQGVDESIAYTIDVTAWGNSPTSTSAVVKDITDSSSITDVTSTIMPSGSTSVSDNIITLPAATAMTAGKGYRIEVKMTLSGNVQEAYFIVRAEV